jgi:hypothetical protein
MEYMVGFIKGVVWILGGMVMEFEFTVCEYVWYWVLIIGGVGMAVELITCLYSMSV